MDSFHHKINNVQSPHQTKHIDKHKTATIKTTETNFDFNFDFFFGTIPIIDPGTSRISTARICKTESIYF